MYEFGELMIFDLLKISAMTTVVTGNTTWLVGSATLYCILKILTDRFQYLPTGAQYALSRMFQNACLSYFRIEHATPSVMVRCRDWVRPQVIMTGPHGVFNMGGIVSIMTSDYADKNVVCALDPKLVHYAWFQPILHMAGSQGMIPLRHASITAEMHIASRDLMVIPGGFVETNTGNEHYATMDDSRWDYW